MLEVFWEEVEGRRRRGHQIFWICISQSDPVFRNVESLRGGEWRMGWKWQTSDKQSLELSRVCWCILFRKTKNIILNTRIILQLKKPALASHSSVPEVEDSMRQNSREQGFYALRDVPVRGTSLSQSFQVQPPGSMAFLLAYPQMALLWEVWWLWTGILLNTTEIGATLQFWFSTLRH